MAYQFAWIKGGIAALEGITSLTKQSSTTNIHENALRRDIVALDRRQM